MDYFGDASGHLRGLLTGACDVYVAAVVAGDRMSCGRCAKRAVRRVDDIPEAKWNDLMPKQKRRLFECFADNDHIEFGYVEITQDQLQSLQLSHLLYQDALSLDWDLALEGYAYGELLFEMDADEEQIATFTFDRVASKAQSEAVLNHINHFVDDVNVFYEGSRKSAGIQSADCLAGGVAEDLTSDSKWLSNLDNENIYDRSHLAILQLEKDLEEFYSEP